MRAKSRLVSSLCFIVRYFLKNILTSFKIKTNSNALYANFSKNNKSCQNRQLLFHGLSVSVVMEMQRLMLHHQFYALVLVLKQVNAVRKRKRFNHNGVAIFLVHSSHYSLSI